MIPPARAAGSAETADLTDAIRRLARTSVLVVGDAMLDRYVYGAVNRISPEAPIPILSVERDVAMPGGAGNVVRNLTALGAAVAFVSVVGDDQAGSDLTGLIGGQPNVEPWLLVQGGRTTTTKTRYVAQGQQLLRADHEIIQAIHPKLAERLLRITQDALTATTVTVLSDYNKGVLAGDVSVRIIAAAKAANRKVVVDPKGRDYGRYAGADVSTPNRREWAAAPGRPVEGEAARGAAAIALQAAHGFGAVLVTRSEDGMSLVQAGEVHHFPAEAAEVYDVSGAGDTVIAAMALCHASGRSLSQAMVVANAAASVVVSKLGTATADMTEVMHELDVQDQEHTAGLVLGAQPLSRVRDLVAGWKAQGLVVGFTNGCFDILHPGHVALLAQARGACDRLVVALNTDASVRRLKGPARPVNALDARASVIAALRYVDCVTWFDEDTPQALIQALLPEVLVKGADYQIEQVIGADIVQAAGGRVVLAKLVAGQSTTQTLARIQSEQAL